MLGWEGLRGLARAMLIAPIVDVARVRYYCCSAADNKIHKNGEIPSEILAQAREDLNKNYATWRGRSTCILFSQSQIKFHASGCTQNRAHPLNLNSLNWKG